MLRRGPLPWDLPRRAPFWLASMTAMAPTTREIESGGASIFAVDYGGDLPVVILLHGLAGSSRELQPTAEALSDLFRVILIDQRGHGMSSRRPISLSRKAFVGDVLAVMQRLAPDQKVRLVGQSMGAHTAMLVAAEAPWLVDRVVMLEGHVGGSNSSEEAEELGRFFASWPIPFENEETARAFLGAGPLADAWIHDMQRSPDGLHPRFDADVMQETIAAVHEPRWMEWDSLSVPVLAVFAENGMFTEHQKDELIRRGNSVRRADLCGASHDAHLDAFESWIQVLREYLLADL